MEKIVYFVIMNPATSAVLGIIGLIFLFFVINNLRGQNYSPYSSSVSFWRRFGMLVLFIPFVLAIGYGIQLAPALNLSTDGASIICTLAFLYFLISCRSTDNDISDILF